MAKSKEGWQVWFVRASDDQIVGSMSKNLLMSASYRAWIFDDRSGAEVYESARELLYGPHPLDHHGQIRISMRFKEA